MKGTLILITGIIVGAIIIIFWPLILGAFAVIGALICTIFYILLHWLFGALCVVGIIYLAVVMWKWLFIKKG